MKYLKTLALLVLSGAGAYALIQIGLTARAIRLQVPSVVTQTNATLLDVSRLAQDTTGVTAEIRKTLKSIQSSNQQTAANSAAATATLNVDLIKLGKVLDQASLSVDSISSQTVVLSTHANDALDSLQNAINSTQPAIANATQATQNAANLLGDPNLRAVTANASVIAQNTADTSRQIDLTAHDVQAFVHRETTPVRGTWNVIKAFLMQVAGPASSVAMAVK